MILNGSPMSLWASDQYLDNKASWIAYSLLASLSLKANAADQGEIYQNVVDLRFS
jgi:hypothetical protein